MNIKDLGQKNNGEKKKVYSGMKNIIEKGTALLPEKEKVLEKGEILAKKGGEYAVKGVQIAKKGVIIAKDSVVKGTTVVREKSKETQVAVLTYIDDKKNARFLEAKLSAFEDGLKEGKVQASDYIKKYTNFCLAATAISYYFARCNGDIGEREMLEIQFDLDSILKNKDLPDALKNKMYEISNDTEMTFEGVTSYLDGVGIETLIEFSKDVDEIILADSVITPQEEQARKDFDEYLLKRLGSEKDE